MAAPLRVLALALAASLVPLPAAAGLERPLSELDPALDAELARYGTRVGVSAIDLADGRTWSRNGERGFWAASSAKLPILLAVLETRARAGRPLSRADRSALGAMIRWSDNLAASRFYSELGRGPGLRASMRRLGFTDFPDSRSWSGTPLTPRLYARIWAALATGRILRPPDRAYALDLLGHVSSGQRFGVGDTAPEGARVHLKNGWVATSNLGWAVNSGGLVVLGSRRWVIAVFTIRNQGFSAGRRLVERTSRPISRLLASRLIAPTPAPSPSPTPTSSLFEPPLPSPSVTPTGSPELSPTPTGSSPTSTNGAGGG